MDDSEKQHKPPPAASWALRVVLLTSCLAWTCASSAAILANKTILVQLQFPYPVTVSWLGLLTTVSPLRSEATFAKKDAHRKAACLALHMPLKHQAYSNSR